MRLLFAALVAFSTVSAQPLRLHPDNPHYFLFAGAFMWLLGFAWMKSMTKVTS